MLINLPDCSTSICLFSWYRLLIMVSCVGGDFSQTPLVHAGEYRTGDILKIQTIHGLKTIQKNKQRKTQQNRTTLV